MEKPLSIGVLNRKGMGMIEVMAASLIFVIIAMVAFSYMHTTRLQATRQGQSVVAKNLGANIGAQMNQTAVLQVLNSDKIPPAGNVVPSNISGGADGDPMCCLDDANDTHCSGLRRNLLCGRMTNTGEPQAIRNSTTWAKNFYVSCKDRLQGTGANACNSITNQSPPEDTEVCDEGLVFDDLTEITAFYGLLLHPQPVPNNRPEEITLYMRANNEAGALVNCGLEPVWTRYTGVRVTLTVVAPETSQARYTPTDLNTLYGGLLSPFLFLSLGQVEIAYAQGHSSKANRTQTFQFNLTWMPDYTTPNGVGVINFRSAGDNNQLSSAPNAWNADNETMVPPWYFVLNNVYFQSGNIRFANSSCTGELKAPGPTQEPGFTYPQWDKVIAWVDATEDGSSFVCSNGLATGASDLNSFCTINSGTLYLNGFQLRAAWGETTGLAEGTTMGIGVSDAYGNKTFLRNITASPGYCPPTNTYCADGRITGPEAPGVQTVAGTGTPACSDLPTFPNATPSISCHPHDGCFGLCPAGTRSGQSCPATNTYCTSGVNLGARGCTAGIDCTADIRCSDFVCDDCGQDTCANSTIAIGTMGECAIYSTNFYCPAGAAKPALASGANVAAGPFNDVGSYPRAPGNPWYLPKDACGNNCANGTAPTPYNWYDVANSRETGCPSDLYSYCWSPGPHAVSGQTWGYNTCEAAGIDCSINAHDVCGAVVCDSCGRSACGNNSHVLGTTGCPATNTYCPDDETGVPIATNGATFGGGSGPADIHRIPIDNCGYRCAAGTISVAAAGGCASPVYEPAACNVAQRVDGCGRNCTPTHFCPNCPALQAATCAGLPVLNPDTGTVCPAPFNVGTLGWEDTRPERCAAPAPQLPNYLRCTGLNNGVFGTYYSGGPANGTKIWNTCAEACLTAECGTVTNRSCQNGAADPFAPSANNTEACLACTVGNGTPGGIRNDTQCAANQPNTACAAGVTDDCSIACAAPNTPGTLSCCAIRENKYTRNEMIWTGWPTGLNGTHNEGSVCWGEFGSIQFTSLVNTDGGAVMGFDGDFGDAGPAYSTTCDQNKDKIPCGEHFALAATDFWGNTHTTSCTPIVGANGCAPVMTTCQLNAQSRCTESAIPDGLGGHCTAASPGVTAGLGVQCNDDDDNIITPISPAISVGFWSGFHPNGKLRGCVLNKIPPQYTAIIDSTLPPYDTQWHTSDHCINDGGTSTGTGKWQQIGVADNFGNLYRSVDGGAACLDTEGFAHRWGTAIFSGPLAAHYYFSFTYFRTDGLGPINIPDVYTCNPGVFDGNPEAFYVKLYPNAFDSQPEWPCYDVPPHPSPITGWLSVNANSDCGSDNRRASYGVNWRNMGTATVPDGLSALSFFDRSMTSGTSTGVWWYQGSCTAGYRCSNFEAP